MIPLSSHDSTLLNHCRYLTIKITQTQGAAIPVIGSLKVIAYPHTSAYIRQPKMPSAVSTSGHVRPPGIPNQKTLDPVTIESHPITVLMMIFPKSLWIR